MSQIRRWSINDLLFDPVSDDNAENIQCKLDGDELTSGCMLSCFGGPNWNDGVENAGTPAVDETSADHPGGVHSSGLKRSADDSPSSSKSDRLDTAIAITEGTTDETAHEGTEIVD